MKWFKTKKVRNRIFYTILILIIFQIGTFITLPNVKINQTQTSSLGALLNLTSGGALSRFGLLALGVSPYISASIVIQMLSKGLSPYYTELTTRGRSGSIIIAQHTRIWSIFLGFVQAIAILFTPTLSSLLAISMPSNNLEKILLAFILTVGSLFVSFLGDLINENGIGNGQSLIIATGILTTLPVDFYNIISSGQYAPDKNKFYSSLLILIALYIIVVIVILIANSKEYRFELQSKMNNIDIKAHYLPIKLLASSVVPVVFATSTLTIIQSISLVFKKAWSWTDYRSVEGLIVYTVLIFLFTFLYNFVQIDSKKISADLIKSGTYIKGISNLETRDFLNKKVLKLSSIGAPTLSLIAGGTILASILSPLDFNLSLTGVSLLILVSALQEVVLQVKGLTNKHNYKELI